jgi:hypothetical protein
MLRGIVRSATILLTILLLSLPAHADRVTKLTKMLDSSSEKTRLAAVVSLAKIGTKRALKPLVNKALKDPNAKVRTLTAAALGNAGSKATLPALKRAATGDSDPRVRRAAKDSAIVVAQKHKVSNPFSEPETGTQPRVLDLGLRQPDLYVTIKNANDDSPGTADKKVRLANAEIVRGVLVQHCRSAPLVTMAATEARRYGLPSRQIDVSVTKLDLTRSGHYMELDAQLRVAISDDQGKMLSFLSGGAKVQVPAATFQSRYLPQMRKEALENAMRGMVNKLLAHLRDRSQS